MPESPHRHEPSSHRPERSGSPETGAPTLSIVVAACDPGPVIGDCLEALGSQMPPDGVEIIVADCSTDGSTELVGERFPDVVLLHFDGRRSVPQLRAAGIAAARGELIGILDPFCIPGEGWPTEVIRCHRERPEPAIGGPVALESPGSASLTRWATYLYEYWEFVPPARTGPATVLTGNNITYKRCALDDASTLESTGFWKAFTNERLRAEGFGFWTAASLSIRLRKPIPLTEFVRSRYHHGRSYAAMRTARASAAVRWLRAAMSPLLPPVLLVRQLRGLWFKRPECARFLLVSPLLTIMHISWAWGELCGYLFGPGRSDDQLVY